ncbi:MAG: DUF3558 domain-containing protein [Umezawaea sp.]
MNRSLTRIAFAATASFALLTAGCGGESGKALPGTTTETTISTSSPSATGKTGDSKLAALKPCDLLTETEVTALGLTNPGEAEKIASAETCDWKQSGNGGLLVGIRAKQGIKDLTLTGTKSPTKIGKYEATKIEALDGAPNSCAVIIPVSESSSVQIIGNFTASSTDTAGACERATKAAELIAPKLP